jgi:hypothetical protein
MLDWEIEAEDYLENSQWDYIEQLLQTACISPEEKRVIESSLHGYTQSEADEVIQRLKDSQVNPIEAGLNYSQTDISKHIKNIIE